MKRILTIAALLLLPAMARAQGVSHTLNPAVPNGTLYVCTNTSVPLSDFPCTQAASIYSDAGLTMSISQPVSLGGSGAKTFYAAPGSYLVQIGVSGSLVEQYVLQLTGVTERSNATYIQGLPVSTTAPTNGQCLTYTTLWIPGSCGSAGGLSGMTAGQIPVAATATTVTSSVATSGSGNVCLSTSCVMTTPNLGTPSAATLTNATGLPISSGVSGLGTGVATFLATPSSANLLSAMTTSTGSGLLVFATTPTFTTPVLGVATATTINKVTLTAPATGSTLTLADGKTLTVNNSLTLAGTDSTTTTFPNNSGTVMETNLAQTVSAAQTNSTAGAASTSAQTYSGTPFTGGTGTTTFPLVYINTGSAPTTFSTNGEMFGINAPSGFTGDLLHLFTNGVSKVAISASSGTITSQGTLNGVNFGTGGNCSSSASPSVCGSSAAGSVVIAASATTVTVDTTAVDANSQIFLQSDDSLGSKLSVTCNTTTATITGGLAVTARSAGTSFQITSGQTPSTNPLCISYWIIN